MKKTVILFITMWGAVCAGAQTTCETRVDAHQKATTNQRVSYCLEPGYGEEDTHGPQLVFSTVDSYSIPQAVVVPPGRPTAKKGYFDDADVEVTRSFVQTRQFPKLTDGRVSEQYKREYAEAMASGPEAVEEVISLIECEPKEDVPPPSVDETNAGLKARHTKPGRRWTTTTTVQEQPLAGEMETIEEIPAVADSYTYDQTAYAPAAPAATEETASDYGAYAPAGIAGAPQEDGQAIDAGAYSYAPANTQPAAGENDEIAAGEYSYAPATN